MRGLREVVKLGYILITSYLVKKYRARAGRNRLIGRNEPRSVSLFTYRFSDFLQDGRILRNGRATTIIKRATGINRAAGQDLLL